MEKLIKMKLLPMYKLVLLAGIVLISASQVVAQDTLKLTFSEAVDIALSKNLDFQTQSNQMEVLKRQKQAAFASHFPSANIGTTFQQQSGQQYQQVEGEIVVTNVTNEIVSAGLNMNLPLFNSGRRILDTQSARLAYMAGEKGLERAAQQVIFDVSRRYLQVLLDSELLRISLENLENQKKQLEQITGFVDAGLRTVSDQYNQESEVARLESVAITAEVQLENDLWDLSEYLQLEPTVIPELEAVDPTATVVSFEGLSVLELYELAKENRSDLEQQSMLVESTKKSVKAMKAMYYPRLNAFYNYNTFFTSLDDRNLREQLLKVYPQNTIGINLSIPIFNNFQTRLDVGRRNLAYKNQIIQKQSIDRRVFQEVKLAYQNYRAAVSKEENTQVQVLAAEEALNAVRERFRLGLSNFVDLSTANQQLVAAQADQAQALFTLYFQEVQMKHALGTLDVGF
ncbi:putative outer membrane efflux protein [Algoriphagus machipongonensis]|uniref:Outer membrane efflux protein n=2 Tax=Algoriphagus machipongonensis TaxID=388413 RepID=A3I1M3_9BACT|nr:putative outer membrane efflux protein [Algoriphagus machipongonensis]